MKEPTMIFRSGDSEEIWGISLDTKIVDAHELDEHLADGWHTHPFDARDAAEAETPTADSAQVDPVPMPYTLEQRAAALGLKIDGRWSPETLAEKIAEAEQAATTKE